MHYADFLVGNSFLWDISFRFVVLDFSTEYIVDWRFWHCILYAAVMKKVHAPVTPKMFPDRKY